ncbi:MAG: DM13 domain-containing protein [Pseudomonadota bacterium]
MRKIISLFISHGVVFVAGFGLGIYLLPILVEPPSPDAATLEQSAQGAMFGGEFTRDLAGSDFLHWGEGTISLTQTQIVHTGALSPGPDYRVYLVPSFVEDEAGFEAIKETSLQVGGVSTFGGFIVDLPTGVDLTAYTTVVIWCERFGEFITAAQYR